MTVNTQVRTAGPYAGNGTTATYPFAFKVFQASELVATITNADGTLDQLALSSDFTVSLNSDQNAFPGGSITLLAGNLASGRQLTMTSDVSVLQPTELTNQGGFFPKVIENALDRLTILLQQYGFVNFNRSVRVPEIGGIPALPSIPGRANRLLGFDGSGNPVAVVPNDQSVGSYALTLLSSIGSSLIGFMQPGGATYRTAEEKLREQPVSILDYSGLCFTASPKDPGDGNSNIGLANFVSWRPAIQKAIDVVSARGGGRVLIPWTMSAYYIDDYIETKANVTLIFEGTVKLADYTTIGAMLVNRADGVTIENPLLDGSGIYAGGSGQNGIGIVSGNRVHVLGGAISNCARGQDYITPGSPNDGGKGVQVEDGAGEDILIDGTSASNCFMAWSCLRSLTDSTPYYGVRFLNTKADNCSILLMVRQTNGNSTNGLQQTVQFENFYAVNCGAFEGALQFSRASNVRASGMLINDPGVVNTSLIRGNHRNCHFDIQYSGSAGSLVNLDPGTYCPDDSYPAEGNEYLIQHVSGTVDYIVKSNDGTGRALDRSTGRIQMANDVGVGFFGYAQRNGYSAFQVSQGGRTALVGTNTNYTPDMPIRRFVDLPVNFSIPYLQTTHLEFPASQIASTDPNTLDDYEEGVWFPSDQSGASLVLVGYGDYVKVGRLVTASFRITFPATASTSNTSVGGLPFTATAGHVTSGLALRYTDQGSVFTGALNPGTDRWTFFNYDGAPVANSAFSGKTVDGVMTYLAGA